MCIHQADGTTHRSPHGPHRPTTVVELLNPPTTTALHGMDAPPPSRCWQYELLHLRNVSSVTQAVQGRGGRPQRHTTQSTARLPLFSRGAILTLVQGDAAACTRGGRLLLLSEPACAAGCEISPLTSTNRAPAAAAAIRKRRCQSQHDIRKHGAIRHPDRRTSKNIFAVHSLTLVN